MPEGSCAEIEQKGSDRLLQAAINTSRGRVVPRGACAEIEQLRLARPEAVWCPSSSEGVLK